MRYDKPTHGRTLYKHLTPDRGRFTLCGVETFAMHVVDADDPSPLCPRCNWLVAQVAGHLAGKSRRTRPRRRRRTVTFRMP